METHDNSRTIVVEKDIHCPFCNGEKALLFQQKTVQKFTIQLPETGIRFMLLFLYGAIVQLLTQGLKLIERKDEFRYTTYAFCPNCGNTFSMAPPEAIRQETQEPKLRRCREGKMVSGMCAGIAKLTGLSVLRVRILTVLYCLSVLPAFIYFWAAAMTPFEDETHEDISSRKLYRVRKGSDLMGLCRGISEYAGIAVWLVRLLMMPAGPFYFLAGLFVPVKEDVEQGIGREKLRKQKDGKFIFGVCTAYARYAHCNVWLMRFIAVLLPPVYFVSAALMPNEEGEDYAEQ